MSSFKRNIQCLTSRGILLVILWEGLIYANFVMIRNFAASYFDSRIKHNDISLKIGYCLIFLSFPLFGLLADVKTGRYKTIITGVYFVFASWILSGLAVIVKTSLDLFPVFITLFSAGYILQAIGYSSVRSNIVQFNIGQSVGSSADELSAIIHWHLLTVPIVYITAQIVQCLIKQFIIVSYIVSGVAVSSVIVSNLLFKHWLDTTPHNINPVKLIANVLNYARKNKYPRNRSALTYWEEDYPSRLDLGKEKYGGPFLEEQVEDVKTFLRLSPLLICIVGLCCVWEIRWEISDSQSKEMQLISLFVLTDSLNFTIYSIYILLYQWIIYPYFYKYIPSMLKRIGLGMCFALFTLLYYVIMIACKEHFPLDTNSYKAIVIPQILFGLSLALIVPASLEFTIAQSPLEIRGLMIGFWFAAYALGYAINISGKYSFKCEIDVICQNLYYYIFKSVVFLIIMIVFLVLAKRYKLRVRENEVNIYLIAEEHYDKYIEQEVEYRKEMGLSDESTD